MHHPTIPTMINTNRYAALALLATLAACGTKDDAPAAGGAAPNSIAIPTSKAGSDDADLKEINSYRLTMDDVRKFAAIKAKGDKLNLKSKDDDGDSKDDESLDGLARKFERNPQLKALIESEGMDTRQFAVVTWTFIQAGFIQMAVDEGANLDSLAKAENVNVENLKFLKAHEKEVAALGLK